MGAVLVRPTSASAKCKAHSEECCRSTGPESNGVAAWELFWSRPPQHQFRGPERVGVGMDLVMGHLCGLHEPAWQVGMLAASWGKTVLSDIESVLLLLLLFVLLWVATEVGAQGSDAVHLVTLREQRMRSWQQQQ